MKKVLLVVTLITVLLTSACQVNNKLNTNIIPTISVSPLLQREAADDILETPNGPIYRANLQREGVENKWPPIETTEIILGNIKEVDPCNLDDCLLLTYRDYIEIRVGETQNNILRIEATDQSIDTLNLYAYDIPQGIVVKELMRWQGGLFKEIVVVLSIVGSQNISPGDYYFRIGIEVNNQVYGTVPILCTIRVIG